MSEIYTLTLEGTTEPDYGRYNEFAECMTNHDDSSVRVIEKHDFENFLVEDMEHYVDDFNNRLMQAWDIASDLLFFDAKPLVAGNVIEGEDEGCGVWPVTTGWMSSCQIKINDPKMLPVIREMINYIGKYNGDEKGTRFSMVSLEPVATVNPCCEVECAVPHKIEMAPISAFEECKVDEFVGSADDILYGSISR